MGMEHAEGTAAGRSEEFLQYARRRASRLHQSAYVLCGDWHLAEDLVQDTMVKVYRHWPRVRRADNPDAYVQRILLNEARDRWKQREKAHPVARFTVDPAVPDETDDIARRDGVLQALTELPFRQRATVVLRYLEGLTQAETAELLGCDEGTVKSQSSRALTTLRVFLNRTDTTS